MFAQITIPVVHLHKPISQALVQSCANMIRVSGYLIERALQKGRIVKEITAFWFLSQPHQPSLHIIKV